MMSGVPWSPKSGEMKAKMMRLTSRLRRQTPPERPTQPQHSIPQISEDEGTRSTKKILELLNDNNVVVLHGDQGVGKTWIAREIAARVFVQDLHKVDVTLWLRMNRKYDLHALCKSIARQLFVHPEDWEADAATESVLCSLLIEKLNGKKSLLVLDDLDDKDEEKSGKHVIQLLKKLLKSKKSFFDCFPKVLITAREKISIDIDKAMLKHVKIRELTEEESVSLLKQRLVDTQTQLADHQLKRIATMCNCLPLEVVFRASILNYFEVERGKRDPDPNHDCERVRTLDRNLARALGEVSNVEKFLQLHSIHKMLQTSKRIWCLCISKCYFEEQQLVDVHYTELISYWIMEGCFDSVTCVETTYKEAHAMLIDLVSAGLLGYVEAGEVVIEKAGLDLANYYYENFYFYFELRCLKRGLGLASLAKELGGLGRLRLMGGKIVGLKPNDSKLNLSLLLADGIGYQQIDGNTISKLAETVQVIGLFHPLKTKSEWKMHELKMLVLREGNDSPTVLQGIKARGLEKLSRLEISNGFSSVPDELLSKNLESLSLSSLKIKSLPDEPFSGLAKLRYLILGKCTLLKTLPSLEGLKELEVIDLSGCKQLNELKDNAFCANDKLQVLDLSDTNFKNLPKLPILLRYLILKGCKRLKTLRSLKGLDKLEVIRLASCNNLEKFEDSTFHANPKLRFLDVSNTNIYEFPIIKQLREVTHLLVKGCLRFFKPRILTNLNNLQVVDYSGCAKISTMPPDRLPKSEKLVTLDLSGTMIEELNLENIETIRHLRLKGCSQLRKLSSLDNCAGLEVLDLSGCTAMKSMPENAFGCMKSLLELDLSSMRLEKLPTLPDPLPPKFIGPENIQTQNSSSNEIAVVMSDSEM